MRALLLFATVTLVVIAGCAGLPLGGSDSDPPTVAPALETTPTRSPSATALPDYPPGVEPNGSLDPWRLARTHEERLEEGPHTTRRRTRIVAMNGTDAGMVLVNQTVVARAAGQRTAITVTATGADPHRVGYPEWGLAYWTNGSVTVQQVVRSNGTVSYTSYDGRPPRNLQLDSTGWEAVYQHLTAFDDPQLVGTVNREGQKLYLIEATRSRLNRSGPPGETMAPLRNLTIRLLVTGDGVVRSSTYRYETVRNDTAVTVTVRFELVTRNTTTVPRPAWFDRARNASSTS